MTSYLFFREKREATGLTLREFGDKVNVSVSSLTEYQNGNKSLLSLPLNKAIRIFQAMNVDLEVFYSDFFPELREETVQKVNLLKAEKHIELDYEKLKQRYRVRIAKIKERKKLSNSEIETLLSIFKNTFEALEAQTDFSGKISEKLYMEKIVPFSHMLKKKLTEDKIKNAAAAFIDDAFLKNDMTYAELGHIVDVTPKRLTMCRTSEEGYSNMKIGSVLKICYALNVPFKEFLLRINI